MATPVANSIPLTGNPLVDGLVQSSSWQFGGGPHVLTYSFSVNDTPNGGPWTLALSTAFTQALTAWSNVADITFVQHGSGGVFTQSTADIAVALTGNELQQGLGAISLGIFPDPGFANVLESAVGYTRANYPHPEGDVFFDNSYFAFNSVTPGGWGLTFMLHELGHALGLKHPFDDGGDGRPTFAQLGIGSYQTFLQTVMDTQSENANLFNGGAPATPMPLDILAIQSIYGANMSYHTGNDTYQLLPYANTIWDAAGTDTLDASNFFNNVTIDLRQGMFSHPFADGNSMTAVAYGVTIENAIGGSENDSITGNDADNTIDGGRGADFMSGGLGNDTYIVDNAGDQIVEQIGSGIDTVQSSISHSLSFAYEIENLTLTGTSAINGTGNSLPNVIISNAGDNVLDGQGGADTMVGGPGNDTYIVSDLFDTIIENAGQGIDTIITFLDYVLPANVENLTLDGAAQYGTGNELDNILIGGYRDNILTGGNGNDYLDGGGNADTMLGGAGNDTYVVDLFRLPTAPTFLALRGDPGNFLLDGTSITVTPAGGTFNITLLDDTADHIVDGLQFDFTDGINNFHVVYSVRTFDRIADTLRPGAFGASYLYVAEDSSGPNLPSMVVYGNTQTSTTGLGTFNIYDLEIDNSGLTPQLVRLHSDFFFYKNAAPTAIYGTLNYNFVDNTPYDVVTENPGEGVDTVQRSVSYILPINVENLTLTGSANLSGTGNPEDNILTSNTGVNTLTGGLGNDTYVLNNAADTVVENPGEGTDTVATSFSYSLTVGSDLENVTLFGSDPVNATGDGLDNVITGNSAPNVLTGGLGNDTLIGGYALDTARFNGPMSNYAITHTGTSGIVTGPDGTDTFSSVERLQFDEQSVVFVVSKNDFNGDLASDILWRNIDGMLGIWSMQDATHHSTNILPLIPNNWHINGTGDFNGDHRSDLIWRTDDGIVGVWSMQDANHYIASVLLQIPTNWHINGTGDFDGDGKSDVIWRADDGSVGIWTMQDATHYTADVVQMIPNNWQISGTGDFNGDGTSDVIWRADDGTVGIWSMQDAIHHTTDIIQIIPTSWHVASTGDFNGDGNDDVLWRADDGTVGIWTMQDSTHHTTDIPQVIPVDWHIAGTPDVNGDGKNDVVWRDNDGTVGIWSMQDATHHTTDLPAIIPTDWVIS